MADIYSLSIRADTSDIRRGRQDLDRFGNRARRTDTTVNRLGRSFGGLSSASGILRNALAGVVASLGVREIIQYSDSWKSVENQLKQVTGSTAELQAIQTKLVSVANETRSSFAATGNLYARLARSTTDLNLTSSDLVDLTTTINKSFAASGATATEAAAAITQLSQGFAAGALRGDEFNSVSEQAPAIMRAIADSLNMTIGELREFASQGGITAEIVVTALSGAADKIASDFSKMSVTLNQSLTVAQNNLTQFIGESESLSTAVESAGDSIVKLSENIETATDVVAALAIVVAGRLTGSLAASGGALAFNAVQAVRVQLALARMAGVSTTAAAGMLALGAATRTASIAMATLGGPVGIVLIAAASLYYFRDALFETKEEVSSLQPELDSLTDSMNNWTKAQLNNQRVALVADLRAARAAAMDLSDALAIAEQKERMSNITSQGRTQQMGANTVAASELRREYQEQASDVLALEGTLSLLDQQLEIVNQTSKNTSTSVDSLSEATKEAAAAADQMAKDYASVIGALNPGQAEFTRYADQLDMIDSFNISMGEKEALREESFRQHTDRMIVISQEGSDAVSEQQKKADEERVQSSSNANSLINADFLTSAENISIAFEGISSAQQAAVNALGGTLSNLLAIAEQGGEKSFQAYKRLAQAEAAIAGSLAFIKALASAPPPFNIIQAASIAALTAVNIASIDQQTYQGARAMGGSVTGGNSYMVGENGPEVVTMGGSGVVTPSSVNNNGGATNVTQVFQLGGGDGDAKRQILAAAPFIRAQAKQAVLEAIGQGGAMTRAVGRRS